MDTTTDDDLDPIWDNLVALSAELFRASGWGLPVTVFTADASLVSGTLIDEEIFRSRVALEIAEAVPLPAGSQPGRAGPETPIAQVEHAARPPSRFVHLADAQFRDVFGDPYAIPQYRLKKRFIVGWSIGGPESDEETIDRME
jgi:hypothetical protein